MRRSWFVSLHATAKLAVVLVGASATSCAVETTKYQAPEALKGKNPPELPNAPAGTDPDAPEPVCATGFVANKACTVKWRELYDTYIRTAWKCTEKLCHGPSTGALPAISETDAARARRQLANYKTAGKPYIDACNTNPAASAIVCNIVHDGNPTACGISGMPKFGYQNVQGTLPTANDMAKFTTWLSCGAPAD